MKVGNWAATQRGGNLVESTLSHLDNSRVPNRIIITNSLRFPIFFPCPTTNVPCANLRTFMSETDLPNSNISWQILQYPVSLELGNLLLEQTKFPLFSLTGIFLAHFPVQWGSCFVS